MATFKLALFTGNYNHIKDGVSLTLNRLVCFLEAHDVEVLVFGPTVDKPAIDHAGTLVPVPSVAAPGREEYRISIFLPEVQRQQLLNFKPDLIHIATPDILGFIALRIASRYNIPVVSSYHTHFTSYLKYYNLSILEPLLWKYIFWFYRKCNKVFVPSESMIKWLINNGMDAGNMDIWTRGIEADLFKPQRRNLEWRRSVGIEDDEVVYTFVSRLVWEKALRTVIDVFKEVKKQRPKSKFLIVGSGPAEEELKREFPEAYYTGHLFGDELAEAYASGDVFFFPSDTESFGNVTLEAMASGLPAVVADAVGSKSLVEHGVNGFICEPGNIAEFSGYLVNLYDDETLRTKMGQESLEKSKHYEWKNVMGKLLVDYKKVLVNEGRMVGNFKFLIS